MTAVREAVKRKPMPGAVDVKIIRHRIGQAWAQVATHEQVVTVPANLAPLLTDEISATFRHLTPADRLHLIEVATSLQAAGWDDDVIAAGLLHDIGKASHQRRIRIIDRGLWVVMRRFSPSLAKWIASSPAPPRIGWGLWLLAHHARIGSAMLGEAGYDDRVCWLVEHHEDTAARDAPLQALIAADDGCPVPARGSRE